MKSKLHQNLINAHAFLGKRLSAMIYLSLLVGLVLAAIEVVLSFSLQAFLSALNVAPLENLNIPTWFPKDSLLQVIVALICIGFLRGLFQWFQEYFRGAAYEDFRYVQRSRLIHETFSSPSASSAEVMTLYNERINQGANVIMGLQTAATQAVINVFLLVSMIYLAPFLTLMLLMASALMLLPLKFFNRVIRKASITISSSDEKSNRRLLMSIKNLLFLRIYGLQVQEGRHTLYTLREYYLSTLSYYKNAGVIVALPQFFGITLICAATYFSKNSSNLKPGEILTYFYLFIKFSQGVSAFTSNTSKLTFYWPQIEYVYQWWIRLSSENQNALMDQHDQELHTNKKLQSPIGWNISNLHFSYGPEAPSFWHGLNVTIAPGKTLVITGTSGAGKTTFLNLLLGELTPTLGQIEINIDGLARPLPEVRELLLANIGYVGPESFLIDGTVRENLFYSLKETPAEHEIKSALIKADCGFVFENEKGLDHVITEQGQGFSAGQKQRLALARALLRRPKALILDEATANLDEETEMRLVDTLSRLKGDTTIIAVTHRRAMLSIADQHLKLERKESLP